MPLGKLGAFGKTNVLDVTGSLFKQYNEGLVQANNMRKENLLMALRERENQRAEQKHQFEMKQLEMKSKPIDLTQHRESIGPELFDLAIKDAQTSGVAYQENGRWYTTRDMISGNTPAFNKLIDSKGDLYYEAKNRDYTKQIITLESKIAKESNPEKKVGMEDDLKKLIEAQANLSQHKEAIKEYAAKKKIDSETPDEKEQSEINKNKSIMRKYDAETENIQEKTKGLKETGGKAVTWKGTNTKNARHASIDYMIQSKVIPPELVARAATGEPGLLGGDETTKYDKDKLYLILRAERPDIASELDLLGKAAKAIYLRNGGQIDEMEAVVLAMDEVNEAKFQAQADEATIQGGAREAIPTGTPRSQTEQFGAPQGPLQGAGGGSQEEAKRWLAGPEGQAARERGKAVARKIPFDYYTKNKDGNIEVSTTGRGPDGNGMKSTTVIVPKNAEEAKQINDAIQAMMQKGWSGGQIQLYLQTAPAFIQRSKTTTRSTGKKFEEAP